MNVLNFAGGLIIGSIITVGVSHDNTGDFLLGAVIVAILVGLANFINEQSKNDR